MKKCRFSHSNRNNLQIIIGCTLLFAVAMIVFAIYALASAAHDCTAIPSAILLFAFGCWLAWLAGVIYIYGTRTYSVDSQGITISYLTGKKERFFWFNVEHIIICDLNHSTGLYDVFDVAIRITLEKEKGGPFDNYQPLNLAGIECWRSRGCGFLRYTKAIILEYSDERLEEIKKASGKEIYDFLTPRARKRGWYEDENGEHQPLPSADSLLKAKH